MGVKKFFGKVVDYVKTYPLLVFLQVIGVYSLLMGWLNGNSLWMLTAILVSVFIVEERIMIYLKSLTEVLLTEEVVDDEKN